MIWTTFSFWSVFINFPLRSDPNEVLKHYYNSQHSGVNGLILSQNIRLNSKNLQEIKVIRRIKSFVWDVCHQQVDWEIWPKKDILVLLRHYKIFKFFIVLSQNLQFSPLCSSLQIAVFLHAPFPINHKTHNSINTVRLSRENWPFKWLAFFEWHFFDQ